MLLTQTYFAVRDILCQRHPPIVLLPPSKMAEKVNTLCCFVSESEAFFFFFEVPAPCVLTSLVSPATTQNNSNLIDLPWGTTRTHDVIPPAENIQWVLFAVARFPAWPRSISRSITTAMSGLNGTTTSKKKSTLIGMPDAALTHRK